MTGIRAERGSALIETLLLVVVLFVPVLSLLGALARIHGAALAVTSAARDGGTAAAAAQDAAAAAAESRRAVANTLDRQGLEPGRVVVRLDGAAGFDRGSRVGVRVAYPVRVLQMPFTRDAGPVVWVSASHTAHVDPYRSEI